MLLFNIIGYISDTIDQQKFYCFQNEHIQGKIANFASWEVEFKLAGIKFRYF